MRCNMCAEKLLKCIVCEKHFIYGDKIVCLRIVGEHYHEDCFVPLPEEGEVIE